MIKLFSSASCTSCRKAKAWLKEQGLEFEERNIMSDPLSRDEIKEILSLTETGTEEIISTRSKVYSKLALDFDTISFNELVAIVEEHPDLLRRPIVTDGLRLQIGFNEDEIHQFIPREIRRIASRKMTEALIQMEFNTKHYA
ncbi:transcriptional regulator Spx [Enterococcus sp. DIV0756]|jgi:transcriptional regulator, Spx/MgsR family|uniref:transcriptional regulator Spx n=1 Tax=Enterococcus sp. DIV0756 TaxID=2774636 RepID=UPI003F28BB3F